MIITVTIMKSSDLMMVCKINCHTYRHKREDSLSDAECTTPVVVRVSMFVTSTLHNTQPVKHNLLKKRDQN